MRQLHIAMGLIRQGEKYLLQLRGENPAIGAAGLIGFFAGKVEPGESSTEAVCRELTEETSLQLKTHEVQYIGRVNVISDHRLEKVKIKADVFSVFVEAGAVVEAKEGSLLAMTKEAAMEKIEQLTPATRACFEELLAEG